jgi:hypothetical protein
VRDEVLGFDEGVGGEVEKEVEGCCNTRSDLSKLVGDSESYETPDSQHVARSMVS